MPTNLMLILPYVGKAYQFAVARGKEWAAADGVENWRDYTFAILEAIGDSGNLKSGAMGEPTRAELAAAEFVAGLEPVQ